LSEDALVRLAPGLPRLVHLRLPASAVSDRSLRTLSTHLPALTSLDLDLDAEETAGAVGVSDQCVALIAAHLLRLRVLGLCGSGVGDGGLMVCVTSHLRLCHCTERKLYSLALVMRPGG
jgi:hypothetical protein